MRYRSSSVNGPKAPSKGPTAPTPATEPPAPPGDDQFTVLFDVWLTARAVLALLDDTLSGTGLDAEDFAVYSVLTGSDAVSPTELARWMSAPPTTVSSYVKRLDARGHIRRVANPEDGRSYRIALTAAGRRAHMQAGLKFLPALERVESGLTRPVAEVQVVLHDLHDAVQAARRSGGPVAGR